MAAVIEIKDMSFSYEGKLIFKDLSLKIENGSFTTIVGKSGCGKTTLAKIIAGQLNVNHHINVCGYSLTQENVSRLKNVVEIIFENSSNRLIPGTVRKNFEIALKSYNIPNNQLSSKIDDISKSLDIEWMLDKSTDYISESEKQLVSLAISILHNPQLLILDDALSMVDNVKRNKAFTLLKILNRLGMTIINFTHNSEDMLIGTDIVIVDNQHVVLDERKQHAFKNLSLFSHANVELPFTVALSSKLRYYDVIDKIYYDSKKLVEVLWK